MGPAELDTPINRATIESMPVDMLDTFIDELQKRRLLSYNIYQAATEARAHREHEKQSEQLIKLYDRFIKKHETVLKGLEALEKTALDILALRLALGHDISQTN
jgi:hypothetical protein